jgi:NDP-sugar pyrophosphorylase family protein
MKAIILAAGKGTRLKPITDTMPKPMIIIGNKPLLEHHITSLRNAGLQDIWVNTSWKREVIKEYFADGKEFEVNLKYSDESELLGTAGALKNPNSEIEQDIKQDTFLITYGDNFTNFDYSKIIKFHKINNAFMTIGLFKSPEPWTAGVVETDSKGRIIKMVEKPLKNECKSDLVNAGIYVCEPGVLNYIPKGFSDFGFQVIPAILKDKKEVYAFTGDYFVQDIGTHERLGKAQQLFKQQADKVR